MSNTIYIPTENYSYLNNPNSSIKLSIHPGTSSSYWVTLTLTIRTHFGHFYQCFQLQNVLLPWHGITWIFITWFT